MTTEEVTRRHSHVPSRNRRQPVTSYRIQLSAQFDFAAVEEIIPYLSSLGVTDVFFSPFCRRRRVQCTATMSSTTNAFRLTSAALRVFAGSHVRFTTPACTSSLTSSPITWLSLRRSSTIARCGQPSVMVRSLRIAPGLMLRSTTPARGCSCPCSAAASARHLPPVRSPSKTWWFQALRRKVRRR